MTVNEIELTLQSLQQRHENLSEAMLLTLLKSGGWDEKMIRDAITLYRNQNTKKEETIDLNTELLPKIQEEPVFVPEVDNKHLLLDQYAPDTVIVVEKEKESLVSPAPDPHLFSKNERKDVEEPPHNLPLKPFETTEQTWSFARYKSIFYGDVEHLQKQEVQPKPKVVLSEEKKGRDPTHVVHMAPAPLSRDEEKLVFIAGTMLLAILLLLGYMYSNGRL
jgi:hypothetical protein